MRIMIGSDHAGFKLKEKIKEFLNQENYEYEDLGTSSTNSVDYPIYAEKVAKEIQKNQDSLGILICGTGLGMCMTANKFKGIRAALCCDENLARLAKEHNNANILCLGGRQLDFEKAKRIVQTFLKTPFSNEERHIKRINEISELEK